ncbi:unnamed protein product [Euphydryas editha]|uniref:Glucose-methanol-choline oxidoreductase N-terminal domain-containing protein n=1 Tax=Euphydryas editha TaxID=104508 RepID=A0AAU9VCX8_EUPED|nr:unnamed protein product [Euphydryas editha]
MWFVWAQFQVKILVPVITLIQIAVIIITSSLFPQDYPKNANVLDGQSFDFVIVGGGSAGCVVANRLTEVGNWSVLLIEAGDDPPYVSEIPGVSVLLGATLPDWEYYSTNDGYSGKAHKRKKIHTIQGKSLGGSSNVNYMYYVKGNEKDYQDWVERGNLGWDWDTVTKYFRKFERSKTESDSSGYLTVSQPLWEHETKEYFSAFKEKGYSILEDTKGYNQLGYFVPSFTIDDQIHRRQSSSLAYIKPIMKRPNLYLLKKTVATKIILDKNKKAIAVNVKENNVKKRIFANNEIIVSAGSLNSPKLLMLSGIGQKEHLEGIDIEAHVDLPNVGTNLQDHMLVPVILSTRNDSKFFIDNFKLLTRANHFPVAPIMGFVALDKNQTFPDYQVTTCPVTSGSLLPMLICSQVFEWNDEICIAIANATTHRDILFTLISFLHPKSRGTVRLKSKNPDDEPIINAGYFSNEDDLKKFAKSVKDFTDIKSTKYFKHINSEIVNLNVKECNNSKFGSQKYWECYVLNLVASQFHYSGTCAMGPEGEGVVDERLRVRGVQGLRVVDASVMPSIVSGNTYATVLMIAEKASDMIKNENGIRDHNS